jgi:hypothetical protein
MSTFDPNEFLDQVIEGENSTSITPCPVGEYLALATKIQVKPWASKDDPSNAGLKLVVTWEIQDESVKTFCDRDKVFVNQDLMLDLVDGTNNLDMGKGKNTGLGRLREAIGQNKPGQRFAYSMIVGSLAKVSVAHGVNKNDPENPYVNVKAVAKP